MPQNERKQQYVQLSSLFRKRLAAEIHAMRVEDARAEWTELWCELSERILGNEPLVARLATILYAHRAGIGSSRILLVGRPGTGKTHIAQAIAEVAGVPFYRIDVQQLSESGWKAMTIESILEAMYRRAGHSLITMEGMTVLLDELDKARIPRTDGNTPEKRRGTQAALLSLLDPLGASLSFPGPGDAGDLQVSSRHMLVIAAGAFSDAEWSGRAPSRQELTDYGLLEELVTRLGDIVHLGDASPSGLARLFADGPRSVASVERELAEHLGFDLQIEPTVFGHVAEAMVAAGIPGASRVGRACIAYAARGILTKALMEGLPVGAILRVTPDDVVLPRNSGGRPDGGGREPPDASLRSS